MGSFECYNVLIYELFEHKFSTGTELFAMSQWAEKYEFV